MKRNLLLAVATLVLSGSGDALLAASIGVQFQGGGVALTSGETAGLVPQANFNVVTGSNHTSPIALNNSAGGASGATLTDNTGGTYVTQGGPAPYAGTYDETLNSGLVNGTGTHTFTISNIPYSSYNLIVYELDDSGRQEGTAIGSSVTGPTAVWLLGPSGNSANYADGNSATPYTYIQATSNTQNSPTTGADYVEFTNLSSGTLSFSVVAPGGGGGDNNGNVFVNGFEIVQITPEPSSIVALVGLCGMGLFGLIRYRRRAAAKHAAEQ
jgi:hypothetical protein